MTVALAVVAATAVVVAVVATARERRGSRLLVGSRAENEQLHAEAERLRGRAEALEAQNEQLHAEAGQFEAQNEQLHAEAGQFEAQNEQLHAEAAQPGVDAHARRVEAEALRVETEPLRAGSAQPGTAADEERAELSASAQAAAIWRLERLRLEREWREIAGVAVPVPVAWDDPVAAALAVELELIRESIGTPGRLEVADESIVTPSRSEVAGAAGLIEAGAGTEDGSALEVAGHSDDRWRDGSQDDDTALPRRSAARHGSGEELAARWLSDPLCTVSTVRVVAELLRCLAHIGEELLVRVGWCEVQVTVAVEPGTERPDLSELAQLATAASGLVEVTVVDEGLQVLVRMPPSSR